MDHAALHKMISEIPAPSKTGVQNSGTKQWRYIKRMRGRQACGRSA